MPKLEGPDHCLAISITKSSGSVIIGMTQHDVKESYLLVMLKIFSLILKEI